MKGITGLVLVFALWYDPRSVPGHVGGSGMNGKPELRFKTSLSEWKEHGTEQMHGLEDQ